MLPSVASMHPSRLISDFGGLRPRKGTCAVAGEDPAGRQPRAAAAQEDRNWLRACGAQWPAAGSVAWGCWCDAWPAPRSCATAEPWTSAEPHPVGAPGGSARAPP